MAVIDEKVIASSATSRYGLSFIHAKEDIDGEALSIIRPKELENGNGFAITISSTSRVIEVGFKADSFSGSLLRRMGDVSEDKIKAFVSAVNYLGEYYSYELYLNSNIIENVEDCFGGEVWQSFEITCDKRYLKEELKDATKLNELSTKITLDLLDTIITILPIKESEEAPHYFESGLPEGARTLVEVNKYERSQVNRAKCIDFNGYDCKACGFDFERFYGEVGRDYIEVHHLIPVADMDEEYIINPIADLVPLCSNCHSIVHRKNPPYSIDELKIYIKKFSSNANFRRKVDANKVFEIDLGEDEFE